MKLLEIEEYIVSETLTNVTNTFLGALARHVIVDIRRLKTKEAKDCWTIRFVQLQWIQSRVIGFPWTFYKKTTKKSHILTL